MEDSNYREISSKISKISICVSTSYYTRVRLFQNSDSCELSLRNWKVSKFNTFTDTGLSLRMFIRCCQHCIKNVQIQSYSGLYFPASGLNQRDTPYLSVFSPNAGKYRPE